MTAPDFPQEIAGVCSHTSFSAKKFDVFVLDLATNSELVVQNKLRDYSFYKRRKVAVEINCCVPVKSL